MTGIKRRTWGERGRESEREREGFCKRKRKDENPERAERQTGVALWSRLMCREDCNAQGWYIFKQSQRGWRGVEKERDREWRLYCERATCVLTRSSQLLDVQANETFCWCHLSTNEGHSPLETHKHSCTGMQVLRLKYTQIWHLLVNTLKQSKESITIVYTSSFFQISEPFCITTVLYCLC